MRGWGLAAVGVLFLSSFALADSVVHILDPVDDQDVDIAFLWLAPQGVLQNDAPCTNSPSDIVDVVVSATSESIRIQFVMADPEAPIRCLGIDMPPMEHAYSAPSNRFQLAREGPGASVKGFNMREEDGTITQCIDHASTHQNRVCGPQTTPWIEIPLTTTVNGETFDYRGASYRPIAYNLDAYGSNDPKGKFLIFWDHTSAPSGYPLVVPP